MTAFTHGRAPVAVGSLLCDGNLGRLSRSGSYASRQMLARPNCLLSQREPQRERTPSFAGRKSEAGGGHWCLTRISAGKVIDFPIAETGASKEPLVPDLDHNRHHVAITV